tara:strand:+ start:5334 stop:6293 length:960 start_codon:yes stop_codon:yes gene_type:complete
MTDKISTKKINLYGKDTDPKQGVSNEYPTSHFAIRQPCLMYVSAVRNSGKSFCVSKMINQAQKENTFDRIYMITPTFLSNKSYFGKFINEETDVFEPTKDSIQKVIECVEEERDEFQEFIRKKKEYDLFIKILKSKRDLTDDEIFRFEELGFLDEYLEEPKWKYKTIRPPQSCVILDDILSSPAILQSSGLTKIATLNRHIAPLNQPYGNRSACGLAVILISQTYCMPQGVSRTLRENLTHLLIFKNKQDKQMSKIKEELGSAVDEDKFTQAYNMATKEKYGNLLIDFNPKCPTMTFRKNLNELLIFPEHKAECHCDKK